MIYINKIENGIAFKIKTQCYLELLTPATIKLLGSTNIKITKDKNGEDVLYTFVPNESFGQLIGISPKNFTFLETLNSEF